MQKELRHAHDAWLELLDSDIYLIPIRLEACDVPEALRDFQWVNLYEANGLTRLIQAIQVGMERRRTLINTKSSIARPLSSAPSPPPVAPTPPPNVETRAGPAKPVNAPERIRPTLLNAFISDYRLVDFLGAGGMGEVYRGVHTKIGRVVAIKVLTRIAFNSSFVERFFNEARIQARLQHKNIAMLYDFLDHQGQPCIIMEYVDGQTLDEHIRSQGRLQLPDARVIFQAVVEALAYVHSQGIVHRDLKTNNIKIGSHGEVKLLDFGIAVADSSPHLTRQGEFVGTLEYLSPEQVVGQPADMRSDIWALGILLYEMLTGNVPFTATSVGDLCNKISKGAYVNPSALNATVPADIEKIIARCLKKNPADRYQSTQEILTDLRRSSTVATPPKPAPVHSPTFKTSKRESVPAPNSFQPSEIKRSLVEKANVLAPKKNKGALFAILIAAFLLIIIGISMLGGNGSSNKSQSMVKIKIFVMYAPAADVYIDDELVGKITGKKPFEGEYPAKKQLRLKLTYKGFNDYDDILHVPDKPDEFTFPMTPTN